MAFGFVRAAGTSRNYVNVSSSDYEIGAVLSRRQYDKYVERLGKRGHLPGIQAIRETERRLDDLRRALDQREESLTKREHALELERQALELEKAEFRRSRLDAGQRRYNATLQAFVEQRARQGKPISKREARSSAEFKAIYKEIRGRSNPSGNPNIRDQNRFARKRALDALGGGDDFRDVYERLYGRNVPAARIVGGGVRNDGRSVFRVRRKVA